MWDFAITPFTQFSMPLSEKKKKLKGKISAQILLPSYHRVSRRKSKTRKGLEFSLVGNHCVGIDILIFRSSLCAPTLDARVFSRICWIWRIGMDTCEVLIRWRGQKKYPLWLAWYIVFFCISDFFVSSMLQGLIYLTGICLKRFSFSFFFSS